MKQGTKVTVLTTNGGRIRGVLAKPYYGTYEIWINTPTGLIVLPAVRINLVTEA